MGQGSQGIQGDESMKYRIKGIGDSHPVQKDFNKYMNTKPSKLVKEVTNNIIKKYGEKWDISPRILKSRKVWWIPALIEVGMLVEKRAKEEELKENATSKRMIYDKIFNRGYQRGLSDGKIDGKIKAKAEGYSEGLNDQFTTLWQEYVKCPIEDLHKSGIKLRNELIEIVEKAIKEHAE